MNKKAVLLLALMASMGWARAESRKIYVHPFDTTTVDHVAWAGTSGTSPVTNTVTSLESTRVLTVDASSTFQFTATPRTGYENPVFSVVAWDAGSVASSNVCTTSWSGTPDGPVVHITEAVATPRSFTVTFVPMQSKATVSAKTKQVTYDATYGTLPSVTCDGFTFGGWWTSETGGRQISTSTKVTILSDQNLYARWTANTYTITFNEQGATASGTRSVTATFEEMPPAITPPTRTGYEFGGYYADAACQGNVYYDRSGAAVRTWDLPRNTTLYAKWTAVAYPITFDGNGGTPAETSSTLTLGAAFVLPAHDPEREGYEFAGWWTAAVDGVRVTEATVNETAAAQTLYAHWKARTYTVVFSANGAQFGTDTKVETYGQPYVLPVEPTYEGHTFAGWWTETVGGEQITAATTVALTGSQVLHAHWVANRYTVVFSGDGETGTQSEQEWTYGAVTNLPACTFFKKGYDFAGWTNAAGTVWARGAAASNLTVQAGATVWLFAKWNPQTYDLVLDAQGGGFTNGFARITVPVTVDEPYDLPVATNANPLKTFVEWRYVRHGAEVTLTNACVLPPTTGATNLVAVWESDAPDLSKAVDAEEMTFDTARKNCTTNWFRGDCPSARNGSAATATFSYDDVNGKTAITTMRTTVKGSGRLSFDCWMQSAPEAWATEGTSDFEKAREVLYFGMGNEGDSVTKLSEGMKYALAASDDRWLLVTREDDTTAATSGRLGWTNLVWTIETENEADETTVFWAFRRFAAEGFTSVGTARVDNVVWTPACSTNEVHVHQLTYEASLSEATITAVCDQLEGSDHCDYRTVKPTLTLQATNRVWTGVTPDEASFVVENGGTFPVAWSLDFYDGMTEERLAGVPSEVGSYAAVLTAGGKSVLVDFAIEPCPLAAATISCAQTAFTYDGREQTVGAISVTLGDATLVEGVDYVCAGVGAATAAGTYEVRIVGQSPYTGTRTLAWTIRESDALIAARTAFAGKGLADMMDGNLIVTLTNDVVAPLAVDGDLGKIGLDLGGRTLRGVDGTVEAVDGGPAIAVSASAGRNPTVLTLMGEGVVIGGAGWSGRTPGLGAEALSFGSGTLAGTHEASVLIQKGADGANWSAVLPETVSGLVYTGANQTGVTGGEHVTVTGATTATAAGTYAVTVVPAAGFAWEDGTTNTVTVSWMIGKADLSAGVVTLVTNELVETGSSQSITVKSVTCGKRTLASTDYALMGTTAAVEAGTYSIVATGTGNYKGSCSTTWRILEAVTPEPEPEPEPTPVVPSLADDDNAGVAVDTTVKNTYAGWLTDAAGTVCGTVTYSLGKGNRKTGVVKVTAKLLDGTTAKKISLTGSAAPSADGTLTVELLKKKVSYGTVTFQGDSVVGSLACAGTVCTAAGGRVATKTDGAKWTKVSSLLGGWTAAFGEEDLDVILSLRVKAKGVVSAVAYLNDGTKLSTTAQLVVGKEGWSAVPVMLAKKVKGVMRSFSCVYWIGSDGTVQATQTAESFQVGGLCRHTKKEVTAAVSNLVVTENGTVVTGVTKPKLTLAPTTGLVTGSFKFVPAGQQKTKTVKIFAVDVGDALIGFGVCKGLSGLLVSVAL